MKIVRVFCFIPFIQYHIAKTDLVYTFGVEQDITVKPPREDSIEKPL
jgi:hypothetical protein